MTDAHRVIERAIELIGQGWTQHRIARNSRDIGVSFGDYNAVSWCLTGAILRAMGEISTSDTLSGIFGAVSEVVNGGDRYGKVSLVDWNDKVCAGPDEAIEVLKEAYTRLPM